MEVPTLIHFFSPATGVSLELPTGFESGRQDDTSAQYEWRDDDDELVLARMVVILSATLGPGSGDAAVVKVAEAFAASDGILVSEQIAGIDACPTATVVVHLPPGVRGSAPIAGPGSDDLMVHFTAAAFSGRLRTITGFAPWSERDRWIDIYDRAVASCRFI